MSVVTYKCPNCDGELTFDPSSQKFACPYCMSSFTQAQLDDLAPASAGEPKAEQPTEGAGPAAERAQAAGQGGSAEEEDQACLFTCPSCGAEITASSTTAATECFYCHNPVILTGRLDGAFLPQKIVPFKISREEAVERFLAWGKKKWFIPKRFFNKKNIEKLTGVYFPYWLVDADVRGTMTARAERVRTWRKGNTEYIETSHYELFREADIHLEDIIKNGLKKSDRILIDSVHPYDSKDMIPFSMPYLSGFQAEKRDTERDELEMEVQGDIQNYTNALLRDTMSGYSAIVPVDGQAQIQKENWDYTLLPVWTFTYQGHNKKVYFYAMNGQTGAVYGKLPVDYLKLGIVAGIIFAVLFVLLLIEGFLL